MKNEICPTCLQSLHKTKKKIGSTIASSIYHTRCKVCDWPVASRLLSANDICDICMKKKYVSIEDEQ